MAPRIKVAFKHASSAQSPCSCRPIGLQSYPGSLLLMLLVSCFPPAAAACGLSFKVPLSVVPAPLLLVKLPASGSRCLVGVH